MNFRDLHAQDTPLLLCNVWDVSSAKKAEKLNFRALGTSSAAIAELLGYKDGEEMSFPALEYLVRRIALSVDIFLSVDLESGYSRDISEIMDHIRRLAVLGVVGINIEDSIVDGTKRTQLDAEEFAQKLSSIKNQLERESLQIFINVRTDTFLLKHPKLLEETFRRIQLYEDSGADGIFVPMIEKEEDIQAVVASTSLPINVLAMPHLPHFDQLKELGVKRISMGHMLLDTTYKHFENKLKTIRAEKSFQSMFSPFKHL